MSGFTNKDGSKILDALICAIQENKQYLSDIDGAIGDGDHGINMNKGFLLCREELEKNPGTMTHGFLMLSKILMMKIGGSMGPLYGMFFQALAKSSEGEETISRDVFSAMLKSGVAAIQSISPAKTGDKTLMDCLIPAEEAFSRSALAGKTFGESLVEMKQAAQAGRDSTKDMKARLGRSSRLGERSRGVLDAGSVSCCIILCTMADCIAGMVE